MKYASFKYGLSSNLGDEIQTLAVEQYLPRVDARIDRDSLAEFEADEPHVVILQGWFSMTPEWCFPPSKAIVPVFIGFHISRFRHADSYFLSGARLAYLKKHQPIGCRDDGTRLLLERGGIQAYTTGCLTLTFPRRDREPESGRVFIVDGDDLPIPRSLRLEAVRITQTSSTTLGDEGKSAAAQRLLDLYRDQARIVITTRLHCALPCLAMGIPVVFFGDPDNYRLDFLRGLGIPIHRRRPHLKLRMLRRTWHLRVAPWIWRLWTKLAVDWNPRPLEFEEEKEAIRQMVRAEVCRVTESAATKEAADKSRTTGSPIGTTEGR